MTERQKRLVRLTELRNKQHDHAVVELLAARNVLHAATERIEHGVVSARMACLHRNSALAAAETEEWLLACADAEIAAMQMQCSVNQYKPLQKYPSSEFDLSVVTGLRELVGSVRDKIVRLAGERLESIAFLRQYTGSPLPEDRKSVSFRLTVAASDRTLSNDDVTEIRNRVIEGLRQDGFDLRV